MSFVTRAIECVVHVINGVFNFQVIHHRIQLPPRVQFFSKDTLKNRKNVRFFRFFEFSFVESGAEWVLGRY